MIRSINRSRRDYNLMMTGISWKKNYQNLFDYDEHSNESLITSKSQLTTRDTFFLVFRNKKTYQLSVQTLRQLKSLRKEDVQKQKQLICGGKTMMKEKMFQIKFYQPDEILKQSQNQSVQQSFKGYNQHHVVVRSLKNIDKEPIGYKLKSNNIIKLGNCQFFLHSISSQHEDKICDSLENSLSISDNEYFSKNQLTDVVFFIDNNQRIYDSNLQKNDPEVECKYCMMPQSEIDGQFLCSPCKCAGSCGLVHFNCLVKWNQNKVKKTQNKGCIQYNFQKFFCEVCKQQYPQYIRKGHKNYELLPIQKPKENFIILEALNSLKRHIIIMQSLKEQGLTVGRGHQCDLKLQDPTISRRHACIKKVGNEFKIFDLKSKFGTLVRDISLIVPLKEDQKFSLQAGRSVLSFSLIKKSSESLFQS